MRTRPTLPLALPALLVLLVLSIGMLTAAVRQAATALLDPCAEPYSCLDDGTPVPGPGVDPFGTSWDDQRFGICEIFMKNV